MGDWSVANHIIQINGESGFTQVVDEQTIANALGKNVVPIRIKEADFLWTASVAFSTGAFRTRCELKTENRYLDSAPVRSENFWSSDIGTPLRHAPKFIPLNGEVSWEIEDTSNAGGNVVALYMVGKRAEVCQPKECSSKACKCDRGRWGQGRGLFVLHTAAAGVSIPANATTSNPLKVPDYYHFRAEIVNAYATNNGASNKVWKGNVERMDPRDERKTYIAGAQMRHAMWCGSSTTPGRPPAPITAHKASQLMCDYSDLNNNTFVTIVHHAFIGETIDDELLAANA